METLSRFVSATSGSHIFPQSGTKLSSKKTMVSPTDGGLSENILYKMGMERTGKALLAVLTGGIILGMLFMPVRTTSQVSVVPGSSIHYRDSCSSNSIHLNEHNFKVTSRISCLVLAEKIWQVSLHTVYGTM